MSELVKRNPVPLNWLLLVPWQGIQACRVGVESLHILMQMCGLICVSGVRVLLCTREKDTMNHFSPVWSTVARVGLYFAFLYQLPPSARTGSSSAARTLTQILCSASLGTAVPAVAPGTGWLFCFLLLKIQD